ncbi:MAG: histidine phosphatase family protein [Flavobacteriales bacterium]
MKTLYLCRHAKSSWADPGMDDFERPLNDRGLRNAPHMARTFKERGEPVDLIVSSPAKRALTTAQFFASELGLPPDRFRQDKSIYNAERSALMHLVQNLPDSAHRVMLFGHNPGFTELVDHLCDVGVGNMPTCGMVRVDLPVETWNEISRELGNLVWFDHPKRHPGQE